MILITCDLQSGKDCRSCEFKRRAIKACYFGLTYDEIFLLIAAILLISVMLNIFVLFWC